MGLFNAVMALSGMIDTDVIEDERLARHTSYRIGGKAYLPNKALLQAKVKEWIEEFEENEVLKKLEEHE